jgi:hypothetical protein
MKWLRKQQQMNEAFFLAEDHMSMHGVLYKKGSNLVKKFKKRWFVLPDNLPFVQYFSAPDGKLLGHIDINNILSVDPLTSNKKHLHGLRITTSARVYSLYARTIEERDGWCSCLANRLRFIATSKLSIREVQIVQEDEDRVCQTFPKVTHHRHSNSHLRDNFRDSPRRALSDGMLRPNGKSVLRFTPVYPPGDQLHTSAHQDQNILGTSPFPTTDESRTPRSSSTHPPTPIHVSDETARFNVQFDELVVQDKSYEDHTPVSLANSTDGSPPSGNPMSQSGQLRAKVGRLEHIVAEKDTIIASLSTMLKRQSMASGIPLSYRLLPSLV